MFNTVSTETADVNVETNADAQDTIVVSPEITPEAKAEEKLETKVTPETPPPPVKPEIDWHKKFDELNVSTQVRNSRMEKRLNQLTEMVAELHDSRLREQLDDNGNPKSFESNVAKVRQASYQDSFNETAGNIAGVLNQYGIKNNDPRLELAAELWAEGERDKDPSKLMKAEKAVRMVASNMIPSESNQTKKTNNQPPEAKAQFEAEVMKAASEMLQKAGIDPKAVFKVDTRPSSGGASNIGDKDFMNGIADGSIPLTPKNIERFNNLIRS